MIERAIAFLLLVGAVLALASVMNGPGEEGATPDARPEPKAPREEAPPEENEEDDGREERRKKGKRDDG